VKPRDASPSLASQLLGTDRFELSSCLGEGNFGTVYRAHDRERDTIVALKLLHRLGGEAIFGFKHEFRALQDVRHPSLVSLHELFESDGRWFFTMEYVEGVDLFAYVRPTGRYDEARLRDSMAQLADGLCALHDAQLVHRDVKPANVRVTPQGRVVLLDFGLATKSHGSSTAKLAGTAEYMAPEQADSQAVGPAADWYAFGTVLYEALTGVVPFEGPPLAVLLRRATASAPSPHLREPLAPADLVALTNELLLRDPALRPRGDDVRRRLSLTGQPQVSNPPPSTSTRSSATQHAPFIGRARELSVLREAATAANGGRLAVAVIGGETGIGKSTLMREAVEDLAARNAEALVLEGRCHEHETVPYKALDGVVDALSRYLRRLDKRECAALLPAKAWLLPQVFPVLSRVGPIAEAPGRSIGNTELATLRAHAFAALRELLCAVAERRLLVITLDDLQWADADSLLLLDAIVRPPDAPRMLVIASGRDLDQSSEDVVGALTSMLSGADHGVRIELPALSREETGQFVRELVAHAPESASIAEAISREANGHPYFIETLVRHYAEPAQRERGPIDLEGAIWFAIEKLSMAARAVLEVLSLAGCPLSYASAASAAGLSLGQMNLAIPSLRTAHLVRSHRSSQGQTLETFHSRIRHAVASRIEDARRREIHARTAAALESSTDPNPEALMLHLRASGAVDRIAEHAVRGAERAASALAFGRAARLYRIAVDAEREASASDALLRSLHVRLGDALANAGRGREAAGAYLAAVDGASVHETLDLRRRASEQLLRSGQVEEGLEIAGLALAEIGVKLPSSPNSALISFVIERARTLLRGRKYTPRDRTQVAPDVLARVDLLWSVGSSLGDIDPVRALPIQMRAMREALAAGERQRLGLALGHAAFFESQMQGEDSGRARSLREDAARICGELNTPVLIAHADLMVALDAMYHGATRRALEAAERAHQVLQENCIGVAYELALARQCILLSLFQSARYREYCKRHAEFTRDAEERGDLLGLTNFTTYSAHFVGFLQDQPERAELALDKVMARWPASPFSGKHMSAVFAHVEHDFYRGRPGALARMDAVLPLVERSKLATLRPVRVYLSFYRSRAALHAVASSAGDERAQLLKIAEKSARAIVRERTASAPAYAAWTLGIVAAWRGEREGALRELGRSRTVFDQLGALGMVRAVRLAEAMVQGGDRGREETARILDEARALDVVAPERFLHLDSFRGLPR